MSQSDAHFVDCAIKPDNPASGSNLYYPTGLSHLEGETVAVLGDGAYLGSELIEDGAIDLDNNTATNHLGIGYDSTLQPTKLNIEDLGIVPTKKITTAIISFYETLGGLCGPDMENLDTVTFRKSGDSMDSPPALFTGIKEICFSGGYEKEGNIIIRQEQPLPMIVRGLFLQLGVSND